MASDPPVPRQEDRFCRSSEGMQIAYASHGSGPPLVVGSAQLDRFDLLAMAQGGPVAIAHAARHPERISRLAFYGSYSGQQSDDPDEGEMHDTLDAFTSLMIPGATEE